MTWILLFVGGVVMGVAIARWAYREGLRDGAILGSKATLKKVNEDFFVVEAVEVTVDPGDPLAATRAAARWN